ncbi:MAG TPA: hypothetical protein VGN12_15440 [Pirellulales bacterium]|jgi:hypothetical protein
MESFLWRFGFVDVTELARDEGCNFEVWFSLGLWTWCCQHGPRGPRFRGWTREGGILLSLSFIMRIPDYSFPYLFRVACVGTPIFVNVVRLPADDSELRLAVMFPGEKHGRFIDV